MVFQNLKQKRRSWFYSCLFMAIISFSLSTESLAYTLDFSSTSSVPIPETYGDELNIDISYRLLQGFGDVTIASGSFQYYQGSGFGDLIGVGWANNALQTVVAEITFNPSAGYNAIIDNFDLGCWQGLNAASQVIVYNEDYTQALYDSGATNIGGSTATNFNLDISRTEALHLQWQYPNYLAVDNVVYDVTAVPIPSALWLLGSGIIGIVWIRKKIKK